MKINTILYLFIILSFLSSCYAYGPIHDPYKSALKVPPPPVPKLVGKKETKSEYMQKTYNDIKNNLQEANVVMIEDSIKVLFPNNIIYQNKDLIPSSDYQEPLAKFSTLLKKYYKTNILITGHSDSKGNAQLNRDLSVKRALNIKNSIQTNGIASNRLESWGLGSNSPIADNSTEEGRAKNRRVEFVVLYKE